MGYEETLSATKLPTVDSGCFVTEGKETQTWQKLYVYSEGGPENETVWVKLDGKIHPLPFVSSTKSRMTSSKVGDRFETVHALGGIKLVLGFKTIFVCPAENDSCEHTGYEVRLTMTRGKEIFDRSHLRASCGS